MNNDRLYINNKKIYLNNKTNLISNIQLKQNHFGSRQNEQQMAIDDNNLIGGEKEKGERKLKKRWLKFPAEVFIWYARVVSVFVHFIIGWILLLFLFYFSSFIESKLMC